MDPNRKVDNGISHDAGRRMVAYANDHEDIQFLLSCDPARLTEEEQDDLAKFVMRAVVAYFGFVRNEQKIGEIAGLVAFGIPAKLTRFVKGIEVRVREAFGYALALVLGYEEYEKASTLHEADPDLIDKYGIGFYVGDPKEPF